MRRPPERVLKSLSERDRQLAADWWGSLDEKSRADVARMWDLRAEDLSLYGDIDEGGLTWHPLPIELAGAFVDEERRAEDRLFKQQMLEYIAGHEVAFFLGERRFHICRAHPEARAAIAAGFLPASFACPLAESGCPMRRVLDVRPGRSVALEVLVGGRPPMRCAGAP